jgi:hypothetical protein
MAETSGQGSMVVWLYDMATQGKQRGKTTQQGTTGSDAPRQLSDVFLLLVT